MFMKRMRKGEYLNCNVLNKLKVGKVMENVRKSWRCYFYRRIFT
jgi:hypothetical protein